MQNLSSSLQRQDRDLDKLFELIDMIIENQSMRIATGVLNEILAEAVAMQQPPSDKGRRLKIYLHDSGFSKAADICCLCK